MAKAVSRVPKNVKGLDGRGGGGGELEMAMVDGIQFWFYFFCRRFISENKYRTDTILIITTLSLWL